MRFVRSIVEAYQRRSRRGQFVSAEAAQDITEQVRARELLRESEEAPAERGAARSRGSLAVGHSGPTAYPARTEMYRIFGKAAGLHTEL